MAGLDEGVGNLERFIEGLQKASSELGEHTSALESAEGDLERLDGEVQDTVGGLADDLEEAADALQQAAEDTRDAVGEVAEAAEDGADSRLADAEEEVNESADECQEQVTQGRAAVDEGFARLSESGFDGFSAALETATTEIGQADDENGGAFDGLEQSVSDMRGRLDEYARTFPKGRLGTEATMLRIEARVGRGDRDGAARLGKALLARHPRGPYAKRVRSLIDEPRPEP